MEISNIDNDTAPEIIINSRNIHIIDGMSHSHLYSAASDYSSLAILPSELEPDEYNIYFAKSNGLVDILGSKHPLTPQFTFKVCASGLSAIIHYRTNELLFSCFNQFGVFNVTENKVSRTQFTNDREIGQQGHLIQLQGTKQDIIASSANNCVRLWQSLNDIFGLHTQ